jgi:hypothetical protein
MPVSLVQRGPFSYDEYTNISSNDANTRTFTLTKAKFDPTIGEVLEVFVDGVKLVGDGTFVTGGSNPSSGASAHEFSVNSAKTQLTIVSDSDLASATDSAVTTVSAGNDILIRRVSDRSAQKVDFAPGSVIREADLDNANTQVFHVAQEAIDTALQGMVLDAGSWNGESGGVNRNIKNVATPGSSDPDHYVATKGYVDGQSSTTTVAAIQDKIVTVAGISNDVTTVAGAVKETVAYTLTASGGKFYIAGGEFSSATSNPVLNLQRGSTYTFDYSDSSISSGSHVLGFSSADTNTNNSGAVAYTGSANGISDNTVDKIITFVVPASAPDTLYYYCTAHNAMGNTMNIAEDSIEIVADNIANVNKVGAIDGNVTKVANIDGDVTKVVALGTDGAHVTTVATLGTNGADVTTVAGKATEIDTLVNGTDGTSGTSGSTNNLTLIDTVEGALPNINTVATNINSVSNFADTYHPSVDSSDTSRTSSTAAPGSASTLSTLTEGDLWFDSNDNTLKVYDGSSFNAATSSISTVADQPEFSASDGQGTDNKYFALVHDVGLELVFLNGVRLKRGDDYYCTTSNTSTTPITSGNPANFIRLETVPGSSDILSVMAFGQVSASTVVPPSGGTFTGGVTFEAGTTHNTGSNTFTMPTTRGLNNYVLTRDDSIGTGGTTWKETLLTPTVSSVSPNNVEETDTTQTIVITGVNFDGSASAVLIDNNGTTKTPTTSTRNSSTQITIVFSGSDVLAETVPQPLDVKVIQGGSTLSGTLENALTIDARPVWSSPSAGALTDQDYVEDEAITQVNFVATDAETTPTYSVTSGALPTGLSLSSAGALTGTLNVNDTYNSSGVQHNFTVTADDGTGNTTDRAFSITRKWRDGSTSDLAATNAQTLYTNFSFTSSNDGVYWIKPSGRSAIQVYCEFNSFGGWMLFCQGDGGTSPIPTTTGASGTITTLLGGNKGKHDDADFNAITWNYCWNGMTDNDTDSAGSGSGYNTMDRHRQNFTTSGTKFTINWTSSSNSVLTSGSTDNGRNQTWSYKGIGGSSGSYLTGSSRQPSGNIINNQGNTDYAVGNTNSYYIGTHDAGTGGSWIHSSTGSSGNFNEGFGSDYVNVAWTSRYSYWFFK